MVGEPLAADAAFIQPEGLNLRAHRAVQQQNSLGEERIEQVGFVPVHVENHFSWRPLWEADLRIDPVDDAKVRDLRK